MKNKIVMICGFLLVLFFITIITSIILINSKDIQIEQTSISSPSLNGKGWRIVKYNGHQYIEAQNEWKYAYAISHDPDCPCYSNRLNQLKQEIIEELKK